MDNTNRLGRLRVKRYLQGRVEFTSSTAAGTEFRAMLPTLREEGRKTA
jgi:hypothetical protein